MSRSVFRFFAPSHLLCTTLTPNIRTVCILPVTIYGYYISGQSRTIRTALSLNIGTFRTLLLFNTSVDYISEQRYVGRKIGADTAVSGLDVD